MVIIQMEALEGTQFHPIQSQSHREACWLAGYVGVPEHLVPAVLESGGWCDLHFDGEALTEVTPAARPKEEPELTPEADRDAMLVDLAFRLTLLELGVM